MIPGTINFTHGTVSWILVLGLVMGYSPPPERPLEFTQATGLARQLAFPFPFQLLIQKYSLVNTSIVRFYPGI